ncbi:hypothetical protein [Frankia sp. AgB32]|uniref:hypothetical protein n=1 Tax=Frankia sp. AgB32 TaxID=631119 RepID=UPI00200DFAE1|nr:hypothetical protein [Frankia sp. AgB32]MCK9893712.1 hypothetical protein [Frankia sp. AgB32]
MPAPDSPPLTAPPRPSRRATVLATVLLGLVLWVVSLRVIRVDHLGSYGLLAALPAIWFVALGLVTFAAVGALAAARPSGAVLACAGVALAVVLYATIPAVADMPQYAYVYKHIGVTRYIEAHHGVDRSIDIYHRWPGFFALAALFGEVAGRPNPVSFAAWAEPLFAVVDLLLVVALARAVVGGTRVPWFAGYLFTAANWIGQNYFAPQAIGFTLALAIHVLVAGQLTGHGATRGSGRRARLLRRLLGRSGSDAGTDAGTDAGVPSRRDGGWPRPAVLAVILLLTAAAVVSHQLTPYLVVLTVGALTVLGAVRPRWLVVAMAALAVAFLVPNLAYIRDHFGLFSGADAVANATNSGVYIELHKSAGKILYARAGLLLFAGAWLAAAVGALVLRRRGRAGRGVLLCSGAVVGTALVLFLQTYGGEGRLRVYLFTLPWCVILVAAALLGEGRPGRGRIALALVTLVSTLGLWMCAFYIPFDADNMTRGDVDSAAWIYDHGDPRIPVMLGDSDWPGNYGPRYAEFTRTPQPSYTLFEDPVFRGTALGRSPTVETAGVIATMSRYGPRGYLVFSRSQVAYAHSYGLVPDGAFDRVERLVRADRHFAVVHTNPDATIYLFTRDVRSPT